MILSEGMLSEILSGVLQTHQALKERLRAVILANEGFKKGLNKKVSIIVASVY